MVPNPYLPVLLMRARFLSVGALALLVSGSTDRDFFQKVRPLNLVTSVTEQEARRTEFTYNTRGLRRKTAYPNGVIQESRYDDSRRLKCIYSYKGTAPAGTDDEVCSSAATSLVTFFSYDYSDTVGGVQSDTNRRELHRVPVPTSALTNRTRIITAWEDCSVKA